MTDRIQTAQVEVPADFIDLGVGQPGQSLLPLDLIRRAATHRLGGDATGYLQYGAEQGDGYFRAALASFLTASHGTEVGPDALFVTAGASQGLDLVSTLFAPPGSTICVEEPSYFLALRVLADHGFRIVGLPTDAQGLLVDGLEQRLAALRPALLYLIPTFQNPTGATLPPDRRDRVVDLARRYGTLVVADEVYHCLGYDGAAPASFGRHVDGGGVLSLGSFSKILAPGLRLGWIHSDPPTVRRLVGCGLLDSGGGLNPFASAVVRSVLELDLLRPHIDHLRATFRARIAAMAEALRRHLPDADFERPAGGYFFWVRLPNGLDAERVLPVAEALGVGFRPGIRFSSSGGLRDRLRLSFAFYDTEALVEGVRRLGQAVARVRQADRGPAAQCM
ncbi:MAG: PLP-dependent aminotransferase family protein [Gemmatimonadetes bacterium]|nr:PLP-dependent aminotransferase family protein [Gemmatimonadota bacterium]MCC7132225.1 PLP-dependent aminotransferase family protein [Gemmatimonadales bacterium]